MINNKCSKCGERDSSVPHKWTVTESGKHVKLVGECRKCVG